VAQAGLGEKMAEVLKLLGIHHAVIVHGEDGLDELTLSGNTRGWEVLDGVIHSWTLPVELTGLPEASIDAIKGGTKEENAAIMRRVFQGEQGPIRDVVLLNSGAVLVAGDRADTVKQGIAIAAGIIDSGEALRKLDALVELSQKLGED